MRKNMRRNKYMDHNRPQINEVDLEAIQELYTKTRQDFDISKVVLFGSRARGDADEVYSDIDLLMLTNKERTVKSYSKILDIAAGISVEYCIALNCLYLSERDWNSENMNPLLKSNIEKEGIELCPSLKKLKM